MLAKFDAAPDLMAMTAIQYLHGRHDLPLERSPTDRARPPGQCARSLDEIPAEVERWLQDCRDYDADPGEWTQHARNRAMRGLVSF
jgi:hypothetical protein